MIRHHHFLLAMSLLFMTTTMTVVSAFGFTRLSLSGKSPYTTTVLHMGLLDFNPFSGGGSGNTKDWKEEQWEAQQAILRNRERAGLTKDQLQGKYKPKTISKSELTSEEIGSDIKTSSSLSSSSAPPPTTFFAVPTITSTKATTPASVAPPKKDTTPPPKKQEEWAIPSFKMPWDK